jgi:hypothetical protein
MEGASWSESMRLGAIAWIFGLRYGAVILGIEVKVQRDDGRNQLTEGLAQIDGCLARLRLDFGWLVIFDRRKTALPIASRLRAERHQTDLGRTIEVIYT